MATTGSYPRAPYRSERVTAAMLAVAIALLTPAFAVAEATVVWIVDDAGRLLSDGSVVFCPPKGDCLSFPIMADGSIALDRDQLVHGKAYSIIVYSVRRAVRFAAFGWVYDPGAFGPSPAGQPVVPWLRGDARREASFEYRDQGPQDLPTPVEEQPPVPAYPPVARPYLMPRIVADVLVPYLFGGNFGADRRALGGVMDVSPGFGLSVARRFGLRERSMSESRVVTFNEVSLDYALNRYSVREIGNAAALSDLTFHRFTVAYGKGRASGRTVVSAAVAIGYGGIYDGRELLEYAGRTYGMLGLGIQGRCSYRLVSGPMLDLGLVGHLKLLYYPADSGFRDHWYGLAPTLSVGAYGGF